MIKETWRQLLKLPYKPETQEEADNYKPDPNETSESVYTPMLYLMYRRGVITKKQYKAMACVSNPLQFEDFMDKLTEITAVGRK